MRIVERVRLLKMKPDELYAEGYNKYRENNKMCGTRMKFESLRSKISAEGNIGVSSNHYGVISNQYEV